MADKKTKKANLWMIAAFVLAVLFLSCIVYICVSKYRQAREAEKAEIFERGALYGYQFAISQFIQGSSDCNPVSVSLQNKTFQFVDTTCINSK